MGAISDKKQSNLSSDPFIIYGVLIWWVITQAERAFSALLTWSEPISHKIALALLALMFLLPTCMALRRKWKQHRDKQQREDAIISPSSDTVYCGTTNVHEKVFIKTKQRAMHTQVIGTTNAGKTESVILPWAIQDMAQGRGLILIDGKADRSLLNKLYAYAVDLGREEDFHLFSLSNIEESEQFNPLVGGTPEEITERVFNAFQFENPYYRSLQFEVFSQVMRIFSEIKEVPTFLKLHQAISDPELLNERSTNRLFDPELKRWLNEFARISSRDRMERTSGLLSALSQFSQGKTATLFNTEIPGICLENGLSKNSIVYFQLPVLLSPFLGKATGQLVLQSLQNAIANRHRGYTINPPFYSVFLDDFSEYLYPGFVSILNKSRSANVGIVFAHQALGDIQTLGDPIANSILTNSNLKIFMRGSDPESAEYFSKVIGTIKATKYTERTKRSIWKTENTGEASAREVEEFIVHPNHFKHGLGVGEAVMVIPHEGGSRTLTVKFQKLDDLEPVPLRKIVKSNASGLYTHTKRTTTTNNEPKKSFEEFKRRPPKKVSK